MTSRTWVFNLGKKPEDMRTWDFYLRSLWHFHHFSDEHSDHALCCFRRASDWITTQLKDMLALHEYCTHTSFIVFIQIARSRSD